MKFNKNVFSEFHSCFSFVYWENCTNAPPTNSWKNCQTQQLHFSMIAIKTILFF